MKNLFIIILCLSSIVATAQTNVVTFLNNYNKSDSQVINTPASLTVPLTAPAGMAFYNDRAVFDSYNPGLFVETWESSVAPTGSPFTTANAPFNYLSNNACFAPGDILPGIQLDIKNNPGSTLILLPIESFISPINLIGPYTSTDDLQLKFNPAVTSVGLDFFKLINTDVFDIDIYDTNRNLITTTSSPYVSMNEFWGVQSTTPIGEIVIRSVSVPGLELIGNVAFGSSPAVPVKSWAIYLVFIMIFITIAFRFRKGIIKKVN